MSAQEKTRPVAGTTERAETRNGSQAGVSSPAYCNSMQPRRQVDIFQACREAVTAEEAARFYGVTFNRRDWALCPFHSDHHPSMSFKAGRYRCWSCNASGDSVDFVGRLFGLAPLEAVRKLNEDFSLSLPLDRPPTKAERKQAVQQTVTWNEFEQWRRDMLNRLTAAFRVGHLALNGIETPEDIEQMSEREAVAIRWQPALEYWADLLAGESMEGRIEIFRDRKAVRKRCDLILNSTPQR